ncbi:MAG: putative metal-binding motif-containing protein [Deltaproteobacteria bacterium]|nr:putative metal-binding motif-containing protein [Deltaproteobacteria bacterium]
MNRFMKISACLFALTLLFGCSSTDDDPAGYAPPDLTSNSDALSIEDLPLDEEAAAEGSFPAEGRLLGFVFQARQSEVYDIVLSRVSGTAQPALAVYLFEGNWGEAEVYATADAQSISIGGWSAPMDGTYLALVDVVGADRDGEFELRLDCTDGCNDPYECASDADCAAGQVCWNGLCFDAGVECNSDSDCAPHDACENGFCVALCVPSLEICDGLDNDCDGEVDEGCDADCTTNADCPAGMTCVAGLCQMDWECSNDAECPLGSYCIGGVCVDDSCPDVDGDGHSICEADCDDNNPAVHPDADDICDGLDNDCDGLVDEGCGGMPCANSADCPMGQVCMSGLCAPMACANDSDCPAGQACWDGVCSGDMFCQADSDCPAGTLCDAATGMCISACADMDFDGFCTPADCDDQNPSINPAMAEICFDGLDNNCDGQIDENCDHLSCATNVDCPAGQVCINGRCNGDWACQADSDCPLGQFCDAATATCRVNCEDLDGDGACVPFDCDDSDPDISPGAPELCDEIDNDCDGQIDEDCGTGCNADFDCAQGEVCVAGLCIAACDTDEDSDGFLAAYCGGADCDDNDPEINPAAAEVCDGLDNDCDGQVDEYCGAGCATDNDCAAGQFCINGLCMFGCASDSECAAGEMCVDGMCVPTCVPDIEVCDGIDNDCDGQIDEGCEGECANGDTMDCGSDTGECEAGLRTCVNGQWTECVGAVGPEQETCDGLDNDCDGQVDEVCGLSCSADSDCAMGQACIEGVCVGL